MSNEAARLKELLSAPSNGNFDKKETTHKHLQLAKNHFYKKNAQSTIHNSTVSSYRPLTQTYSNPLLFANNQRA